MWKINTDFHLTLKQALKIVLTYFTVVVTVDFGAREEWAIAQLCHLPVGWPWTRFLDSKQSYYPPY
jgi:hypothetical protein